MAYRCDELKFSYKGGVGYSEWYSITKIIPSIKRVIFNPPATIVFWNDDSKTVVKTSPHDEYDKEKGILWAFYLKAKEESKTNLQKKMRHLVEGNNDTL